MVSIPPPTPAVEDARKRTIFRMENKRDFYICTKCAPLPELQNLDEAVNEIGDKAAPCCLKKAGEIDSNYANAEMIVDTEKGKAYVKLGAVRRFDMITCRETC
jgi:hypothetical protein